MTPLLIDERNTAETPWNRIGRSRLSQIKQHKWKAHKLGFRIVQTRLLKKQEF